MSAPAPAPAAFGVQVPATSPGPEEATSTASRLDRVRRRALLVRVVATALLVLLVPVSLVPVAGVWELPVLVRVVALGVVCGAAVAGVAAWRRWSAALTLLAVVAGYLLLGWLAVAPPWLPASGGAGGFGAALRTLLGGIVTTWKDSLTLAPPFGEVPELLVAPWLLAFVGAALVVTIAWRARRGAASAALVPLVVLAVALVLTEAAAPVAGAVGVVTALVSLVAAAALRGTLRLRRTVSVVAMLLVPATVAIAAGWLTAPLDRTVVRESVEPPFDPADFESPLATFRAFVKDDDEVELTVAGDLAGAPLRLAVMDSYDGVVWSTSVADTAGGRGGSGSGEFRRIAGALPVPDGGTPVSLDVTSEGLTGVWLPTAGRLASVDSPDAALRASLRYNAATSSAVVLDGLAEGDEYTLTGVVPAGVTDEELADVPVADVELGPISRVPDVVGVVAREWVGSAGSPIEMARALEQRFSGSGWYSDGLTEGTPAGHGADRMVALLESERMIGNAEQYASAMALMARELGLPARVVMGFRPGEDADGDAAAGFGEPGSSGAAGEATQVLGSDVDAWVEIAFEGRGWVAFFPTPDKSRTPDQSQTETDPQTQPLVSQPRPTQPPPADPPTPEPGDVRPVDRPEDPEVETGSAALWIAVGSGAGGLLLLASPFLVVLAIKAARLRRRRREADPRRRAQGAWAEVVALGRDAGVAPVRTHTRREAAEVFGGAADRVAVVADAAQFAPTPPAPAAVDSAWQGYGAVRSAVLGRLTPWRRLRARVSTASLRRLR